MPPLYKQMVHLLYPLNAGGTRWGPTLSNYMYQIVCTMQLCQTVDQIIELDIVRFHTQPIAHFRTNSQTMFHSNEKIIMPKSFLCNDHISFAFWICLHEETSIKASFSLQKSMNACSGTVKLHLQIMSYNENHYDGGCVFLTYIIHFLLCALSSSKSGVPPDL